MLGARFKSWMEAQLGRAKKRKQKQCRQPAPTTTGPLPPPHLSSPESAYSTGYSTDGTSPGAPPASLAAPLVAPPPPPAPPTTHLYHEPAKVSKCWRIHKYLDGNPQEVFIDTSITPRLFPIGLRTQHFLLLAFAYLSLRLLLLNSSYIFAGFGYLDLAFL
jgi:hypothetical protein